MRSSLFQERAAGIAAWLYALWQARALGQAWRDSPFDRLGSMAFLLWCVPVLIRAWQGLPVRTVWFAVGVVLSLLGFVSELNAVKYAGLAVVTCGFLPPTRASWVQLAGSVSWMPALGWVLSSLSLLLPNLGDLLDPVHIVNGARLLIAALTVLIVLRPPIFLR